MYTTKCIRGGGQVAIAPEYIYAKNKAKALGGTDKQRLAECLRSMKRLTEIVEEKGLTNTTLKDAGLVSRLPIEAKHYNMDTVQGFYEFIALYADGRTKADPFKHASDILCVSVKAAKKVFEGAQAALGPEYVALSEDLRKYSKRTDPDVPFDPKNPICG
jgi:hypothetical protein